MNRTRTIAALGIVLALMIAPALTAPNVGGAGPKKPNVGGAGPRVPVAEEEDSITQLQTENVGGAGSVSNVGGAGPRGADAPDGTTGNVGGAGPEPILPQWLATLLGL